MTEKQLRRFYFPAWRKCAEVNDWVMEKRRLVANLRKQREAWGSFAGLDHPIRVAGLAVIDYAEQLAAERHCAVTAEDLRHGCNLVATKGRKSSSQDFGNTETDKVVWLFRLLENPDDLDAVMNWLAYERGEDPGAVKRIRFFIANKAPDAYIRQISADKFGSRMWEWLELGQLQQLATTLANRDASWRRPVVGRDAGAFGGREVLQRVEEAAGRRKLVEEPF